MGMFISMTDIVIMAVASVVVLVFIVMYLLSSKYNEYIEMLDPKEYPLKEIYGVGFVLLSIIGKKYSGKAERNRKQKILLLKGEKYAEYYLRVNAAQRVSLAFFIMAAGMAAYGLIREPLAVPVIAAMAFAVYYSYGEKPAKQLEEKTEEIVSEFSDMVTKLTLLVNAGMIIKDAWQKVAYSSEGELYNQMRTACIDMNNGASEKDAYTDFGSRCIAPEVKKFVSTIVQGVMKGNSELSVMLKQQNREIMSAKQHRVKQQGEKASAKLMIPIGIMFIGILVMVIVPIFTNLGV